MSFLDKNTRKLQNARNRLKNFERVGPANECSVSVNANENPNLEKVSYKDPTDVSTGRGIYENVSNNRYEYKSPQNLRENPLEKISSKAESFSPRVDSIKAKIPPNPYTSRGYHIESSTKYSSEGGHGGNDWKSGTKDVSRKLSNPPIRPGNPFDSQYFQRLPSTRSASGMKSYANTPDGNQNLFSSDNSHANILDPQPSQISPHGYGPKPQGYPSNNSLRLDVKASPEYPHISIDPQSHENSSDGSSTESIHSEDDIFNSHRKCKFNDEECQEINITENESEIPLKTPPAVSSNQYASQISHQSSQPDDKANLEYPSFNSRSPKSAHSSNHTLNSSQKHKFNITENENRNRSNTSPIYANQYDGNVSFRGRDFIQEYGMESKNNYLEDYNDQNNDFYYDDSHKFEEGPNFSGPQTYDNYDNNIENTHMDVSKRMFTSNEQNPVWNRDGSIQEYDKPYNSENMVNIEPNEEKQVPYLPPELVEELENMGLNSESLRFLDREDIPLSTRINSLKDLIVGRVQLLNHSNELHKLRVSNAVRECLEIAKEMNPSSEHSYVQPFKSRLVDCLNEALNLNSKSKLALKLNTKNQAETLISTLSFALDLINGINAKEYSTLNLTDLKTQIEKSKRELTNATGKNTLNNFQVEELIGGEESHSSEPIHTQHQIIDSNFSYIRDEISGICISPKSNVLKIENTLDEYMNMHSQNQPLSQLQNKEILNSLQESVKLLSDLKEHIRKYDTEEGSLKAWEEKIDEASKTFKHIIGLGNENLEMVLYPKFVKFLKSFLREVARGNTASASSEASLNLEITKEDKKLVLLDKEFARIIDSNSSSVEIKIAKDYLKLLYGSWAESIKQTNYLKSLVDRMNYFFCINFNECLNEIEDLTDLLDYMKKTLDSERQWSRNREEYYMNLLKQEQQRLMDENKDLKDAVIKSQLNSDRISDIILRLNSLETRDDATARGNRI